MRSTFAAAAVIATANALVARDTVICCFGLSATGGSTGPVGQIDDGQTRLGSGLQPAQFCIDSSGEIKDGNGRGCFLTPPTSQLQCDTGAFPQPGFSIDSSGEFHHNDTTDFVACLSGQSDQLNIYTNPPPSDVSGCRPIELHADRCFGGPPPPPPVFPGLPGVPQGPPPGAPPVSITPGPPPPVSLPPVIPPPISPPPVSPPQVPPQPGSPSSAPGPSPSVGPIVPPKVPPPPEGSTSCPITTIPQVPPAGPGPGGPTTPGAPNTPAESSGPRTPSAPGGVPTAPGPPPFANSSAPAPTGTGTGVCAAGPCPTGRISPTGTSGPGGFAPGAGGGCGGGSNQGCGGGPSFGGCGTSLVNGSFEFPHLIIPIDSSSPNKAPGTSFNGTVTSTISSIFNFDFLPSSANKQCSLVFLFPNQDQLQTSAFSFSGDGAVRFLELQAPASSSTSFSNAPQVKVDFGVTNVSAGRTFTIATFACPAGQTVAFEMKNAGTTNLDFFEDFNWVPIGLFVTTC